MALVYPAVPNALRNSRSVFQDQFFSGQLSDSMSVPVSDLAVVSWRIAIHNGVLSFPVGSQLSIDVVHFDR